MNLLNWSQFRNTDVFISFIKGYRLILNEIDFLMQMNFQASDCLLLHIYGNMFIHQKMLFLTPQVNVKILF